MHGIHYRSVFRSVAMLGSRFPSFPLGVQFSEYELSNKRVWVNQTLQSSNMAAELGSSFRSSSKRRQGDAAVSPMRGLSPSRDSSHMEDLLKRFSHTGSHESAPSPSAPSKDMTISELTHAYQHLAAQAALDKQWARRVEGSLTDHVHWRHRHSTAGNSVAARLDSQATALSDLADKTIMTGTAGATAGATAPDATDTAVRAHVEAPDAAMGARLAAVGVRSSHCRH